eukprot:2696384-Pleurochrysis_carterae.AAC.1
MAACADRSAQSADTDTRWSMGATQDQAENGADVSADADLARSGSGKMQQGGDVLADASKAGRSKRLVVPQVPTASHGKAEREGGAKDHKSKDRHVSKREKKKRKKERKKEKKHRKAAKRELSEHRISRQRERSSGSSSSSSSDSAFAAPTAAPELATETSCVSDAYPVLSRRFTSAPRAIGPLLMNADEQQRREERAARFLPSAAEAHMQSTRTAPTLTAGEHVRGKSVALEKSYLRLTTVNCLGGTDRRNLQEHSGYNVGDVAAQMHEPRYLCL